MHSRAAGADKTCMGVTPALLRLLPACKLAANLRGMQMEFALSLWLARSHTLPGLFLAALIIFQPDASRFDYKHARAHLSI